MATMEKKYAFVFFALFVGLMFMSGCTSTQKTETTTATAAFVGGTSGLQISLLPGQPPAQVYENQPFVVGIQIENKGESRVVAQTIEVPIVDPSTRSIALKTITIPYGYISVSGIDTSRFGLSSPTQALTAPLEAVKKIGTSTVPGGQTQIMYSPTAPDIVGAQAQFPLKVSALYYYTSKAVANACVKEDIYQQTVSGKEVCKLIGAKTVESSGAPIKVTSVEELPTGFNIKVKNAGSGYPFRINTTVFQTTEGAISPYEEKDKVMINSVKLGLNELTLADYGCSPRELFLVNGEAQFFCSTVNKTGQANLLGSGSEYVTQLAIDLGYGYVTTTSTTLNIQATS